MGGCTTLVYFVARFTARQFFGVLTALIIGQIIAITFAFIVNKIVVFRSKTETKMHLFREIFLFYWARAFSFLLDFAIATIFVKINGEFFANALFLDNINYNSSFFQISIIEKIAGDPLKLNEFIWTFISQVLILIANYLFSKLIIFKKKKV
jgi:putative flippase GtrA